MLALFHDKKCCKCFKLFSCILWYFIVLGLVLSLWRIEHKMKISAVLQLARWSLRVEVSAKKACEKHMLEVEELSAMLHFVSASQDRSSCKVPVKHSAWRILSVTFLPFTHTIYTLITHKSKRGYLERTLDRFLQHDTPTILEKKLLILSEKSL